MRLPVLGALGALLLAVQACTKELLQVNDPDIILDETLKASSAAGAQGLKPGPGDEAHGVIRAGQPGLDVGVAPSGGREEEEVAHAAETLSSCRR